MIPWWVTVITFFAGAMCGVFLMGLVAGRRG